MLKEKWRWLWRHVCRHLILTNCNNPNIISLAPIFWNTRHDENSVLLRGNRRWRPKDGYEGQIYNSIYKVKAAALSLLSCIFVTLFSQRLRLHKFCLSPLSEPYDPPSWWTNIIKYMRWILLKNVDFFGPLLRKRPPGSPLAHYGWCSPQGKWKF